MRKLFLRISSTLILMTLIYGSLSAQKVIPFETEALKSSGVWFITLDFDNTFNRSSFNNAIFRVVDIQTSKTISLDGRPILDSTDTITLKLSNTENLTCDTTYIVYVRNLEFPKFKDVKETFARLSVEDCDSSGGGTSSGIGLNKVKSGTRDDSDIYVSGQWAGASGSKIQQNVDVKVEINLNETSEDGTIFEYGPSFEYLASTAEKADPDSVKLGGYVEFRPFGGNGGIPSTFWKNTAGIESNRDFTNTNFIWDSRATFAFQELFKKNCKRNPCAYFRPFIGQELGYNFRSPVDEAEKKLIFRPYVGGSLSILIPGEKIGIDEINFNSSYIRRFPLKREITFTEDDDDNLLPVGFGRRPKDYVKTNLEFNFNDFWGFKATHEYGSVPPLYKLIDHKFSFGFSFKAKIGKGEQ